MGESISEILRLRDHLHKLRGDVFGINFRVKALEQWKREINQTVLELTDTVDALIKSDEIAEAITTYVSKQHTVRLTKVQKSIVAVAGLAAILDVGIRVALLIIHHPI